MKKKHFYTSLLFSIVSVAVFSQTHQQISEITSKTNKKLSDSVSLYLNNRFIEKENRVRLYMSDHNLESRILNSDHNTSMYLIDVSEEGYPLYYSTNNIVAAASTLTNSMYGVLGLNTEGQDMKVGVWDENRALGSHQEFTVSSTNNTSRMTYGDNAITGSSTDHATHVAGTMVARGANANARGMAFKAEIVSYNWSNDESEVQTEAQNGMLITNHSYGVPMFNLNGNFQMEAWRPGCYTSDAAAWDYVAYVSPYTLSVVSAGNEGNTSPPSPLGPGLDKLVGNKVSKNNLVVANAMGITRSSEGILLAANINTSSSIGPSDDLRIKPDIAGMGTSVFSPIGTSNTSYASLTGTSMAAPNVSGSILLLQQYYNDLYSSFMRAATLKGLVCLTADDAGTEGPDPYYGWGILNMKAASDVIRFKGEKSIIEENNLTNGEVYTKTYTVSSSGTTLLAGISWTDYPGTAKNGQLNSLSKALVNDLDIRITKDGETFFPWMLDHFNPALATKGNNMTDNIEIIRIDNADPGVYTITVSHKGTLYTPTGEQPGQKYSLIISGESTLSVNNNQLIDSITIYPNPVSDILNFEMDNNQAIDKIEIYNTLGSRVLSLSLENNYTNSINISDLTVGIYFVKFHIGENQITKKIVKK